MDERIDISAWLSCDVKEAFNMFSQAEKIQTWLPNGANVESVADGKFEISWRLTFNDINTTIGSKILAYEPDKFLSFELNTRTDDSILDSSPHHSKLVIYFLPIPRNNKIKRHFTEVHLIVSGWAASAEGEALKTWFETTWAFSFEKLIEHINNRKRKKIRKVHKVTGDGNN
jgi:uncharacterized protein YndB with AHSA1/START domain